MSMEEYSLYERDSPALDDVERTLYDAVSREEPWNLVEHFSQLERVSGSEDEQRGVAYLTDRLDALDISYERYNPTLRMGIPHDATVTITSPTEETFGRTDYEGGLFDIADRFTTVKPELYAPTDTVSGELVHVEQSEIEGAGGLFSAIGGITRDIEDKIVLVEMVPIPLDAAMAFEEAGAAGIVCVHPHERKPHWGRVASQHWGNVPESDDATTFDTPTVTVAQPVGDRLMERLQEDDSVEVTVRTDVVMEWVDCPIVVADIPGEAGPETDEYVLLHGHHDSWYPGVTDNATGDAGLLECARVFDEHRAELRRDLKVAWWPGHSQGSYAGSGWFADRFALDLVENCVAHVNMDAPGAAEATEFGQWTMWMPEADPLCKQAIDDVAGKEATRNRPIRGGDYSFSNLGVTGLMMLSSNVPEAVCEARGYYVPSDPDAYHIDSNTLDKADPDVLVRDIRVYVTIVARLLRAEVLPLDHRQNVRRHQEVIADYREQAGSAFDLSPIEDALDRLEETVTDLYAAIDAGEVSPETANEAIRTLSRTLVRVNFTERGQFKQDPTTVRPPYPALSSLRELDDATGHRRHLLRTRLTRRRNRIVNALRDVDRSVTRLLDA